MSTWPPCTSPSLRVYPSRALSRVLLTKELFATTTVALIWSTCKPCRRLSLTVLFRNLTVPEVTFRKLIPIAPLSFIVVLVTSTVALLSPRSMSMPLSWFLLKLQWLTVKFPWKKPDNFTPDAAELTTVTWSRRGGRPTMFIPSAVLISWTCLRTELLPAVFVAILLPLPVETKTLRRLVLK